MVSKPVLASQSSFGKGEITPRLFGRVDLAAYSVALQTARNLIIHPQGGASNRAGTKFIGPANVHTFAPLIWPFIFKTTDTYMLEFGNLYMRVIRDQAHVLEAAKAITNITASHPCVVTAASHGFSTGDEVYIAGVGGMSQVNTYRYKVLVVDGSNFKLEDQVTSTLIDASNYTAYTSGGTVSRVYTLVTPYASSDLDTLKFTQSFDKMTLTHPTYPPYELTRTDHDAWTLTVPTFAPSISPPTGVSISPTKTGTTTIRYKVTAIAAETGEESLSALGVAKTISGATKANPCVITATSHGFVAGDEIQIDSVVGMTQLNGRRFIIVNTTTNTFELEGEDSTNYTTYGSAGTATQTFARITNSSDNTSSTDYKDNVVSWTAIAGADRYAVYCEANGLFGYVGETQQVTFTDSNIGPDLAVSPPEARNPFLFAGNYPAASGYYQQRRVMGGSNNNPEDSEYSKTGSENNYSISTPLQADDAISDTLVSQKGNAIKHYVPGVDLMIFTSGGEWRVNTGNGTGFSADTITQSPQSFFGCSDLRPIISGITYIFPNPSNSTIHSAAYDLYHNVYRGPKLSLLAEHMLRTNSIVGWDYAPNPDQRIHMARDDGQMLTMTFDDTQDVVAWTRWDTLGTFKRAAILPFEASSTEDGVFTVVNRQINGNSVMYIEMVASRLFTDPRDCYFVDCGLSYDSPVAISGVSLGSPCTITATAHGFSNGDQVDLSDIMWQVGYDAIGNQTQPDQLNYKRFVVASAMTNTFALQDMSGNAIDSSAFLPYLSGGNARKAVNVISGLGHLEGQSVVLLADGSVISTLTVAGGQVTLPRRASRVHIGLRYVADFQTLPIQLGKTDTTGLLSVIEKAVARFDQTRGVLYGTSFADMDALKFREWEDYDEPTALFSGLHEFKPEDTWDMDSTICIRQIYPLPMSILSITPRLTVGG